MFVAALVDPSEMIKSIGGVLVNQTGTDLIAAEPNKYFISTDENGVDDLCFTWPPAQPLPEIVAVIGGIDTIVLVAEFIGGRPPTRPPAK